MLPKFTKWLENFRDPIQGLKNFGDDPTDDLMARDRVEEAEDPHAVVSYIMRVSNFLEKSINALYNAVDGPYSEKLYQDIYSKNKYIKDLFAKFRAPEDFENIKLLRDFIFNSTEKILSIYVTAEDAYKYLVGRDPLKPILNSIITTLHKNNVIGFLDDMWHNLTKGPLKKTD